MIERYQDPTMSRIWNRQAELDRWARIEIAAMRFNPLVPSGVADLVDQVERPDPESVDTEELACGHEVIAFLRVWTRLLTPSQSWSEDIDARFAAARQWLHYGLTSSDVVDSGLALALTESGNEILSRARGLRGALGRTQAQLLHADEQIGRTHGQWAMPRPASYPWQVARQTLVRIRERLAVIVAQDLPVGKLSGPVGVEQAPGGVDALVGLGLATVPSTQIVPRDGIAAFASTLADLATFCEGLATQVRLLAQSEVAEVAEGTRVGSSAMPHKRNPAAAENICGLARLARAVAEPLRLGLIQWGDRDLAHSSVERVALPGLCHLAATILRRMTVLVDGLVWDYDRIRDNLHTAEYVNGPNTHARLMKLQREGYSYLDAHRLASTHQEVETAELT